MPPQDITILRIPAKKLNKKLICVTDLNLVLISTLRPQNTDTLVQTLWSYYIYLKIRAYAMLVLRKKLYDSWRGIKTQQDKTAQ